LGLLERIPPLDVSKQSLNPVMKLLSAPDSKESPEILKLGHDGALSIRNFVLMTVHQLKSIPEPL
jgi:hypothetical protein